MSLQPHERYGAVAIALHWLVALLIVCNLLLGLSMVPMPITPRKLELYLVHKWIGITVFLLACARVLWRMWHPAPAPVPAAWCPRAPPGAGAGGWQRRPAAISHALLYVLLLAVPISGWIYSSATGVQV